MAAVAQGPSERDGAYYQDTPFEPDQTWKNQLRRRISEGLQRLVDGARKEKDAHYIINPTNDYEHAKNDNVKHTYEVKMTRIRRMAQDQFEAEMQHERQVRRLAAGVPLDEGWTETLLREQQGLWNASQKTNRSQDRAPSRLASGGSTNAAAGPSRVGLDGYIAGDGLSSVRYDSASGFDDTGRYSRWMRGMPPAQPQPEWPSRRDGEQPRGDADPLQTALERWMPRVDEPTGPPLNAPKNPSKLGRVHFPSDPEKAPGTPRRAGKQIATANENDVPGPDDLRSFLASAEMQLAMGGDAQRTAQFVPQIPVQFANAPHLYDRAQSVTPRPIQQPVSRMASKLGDEIEGASQALSAAQETTRTESYLFAIMQTTSRAPVSTSGAPAASDTTFNMQVVDPRTFTMDDDARSMQSPYQPAFALPDFRPPPPVSTQTSTSSQSSMQSASQSSLQSLWQSAGSRSESEQKSPRSDEMVVVASDEGDSDWEASGFDKDELEKMIEAEMSTLGSDSATIVPEMPDSVVPPVEDKSAADDSSMPGALPEEPEEIKTKAKGGKAKKKEEARRKELEAKRKEEEVKRKAEETKRKEEEAKRREEEAKRRAEEIKRREEEARRKKEAETAKVKPTTAQARRAAAAEEKKKADTLRRFEDEQRQLEEATRAEEALRAEEERHREEEQRRRDAEALAERLGKEKLEAFIKQQEARNKAELLRKPEDKQRAFEEARRAEAARLQELEEKRLEEEKRKREADALAEKIGRERLEMFRKQQEDARRRLEGRQRTDSLSRTPPDTPKPSIPVSKDPKEPSKKASEPQIRKRTVTFAEEDPQDREVRLFALEDQLRRREQEVRRREEEIARKQQEEEARWQEEDRKRKPGAPRTKADELRDKERQLRRQAEDNQKKEQELRKREEALNRRAEELLAKMKAQQEEFRRDCLLMGMTLTK